MNRFFLSDDAQSDLAAIRAYLNGIPPGPDRHISGALLKMLNSIPAFRYTGQTHSTLTRILGTQIRSRLCRPYRIYYRLDGPVPEIIAILHTARDNESLLAERFQ